YSKNEEKLGTIIAVLRLLHVFHVCNLAPLFSVYLLTLHRQLLVSFLILLRLHFQVTSYLFKISYKMKCVLLFILKILSAFFFLKASCVSISVSCIWKTCS